MFDRIDLVFRYLEGDALLWYQLLKQEVHVISWDDFKSDLYVRCGPNKLLDVFGELTKLPKK